MHPVNIINIYLNHPYMKMLLKKMLKFTGYFLLFFITAVLIYLSAAFCLSRLGIEKEETGLQEITIFIKTNGIHTDLVVPVRNSLYDWSREVKFANTHLKDTSLVQWLAIGWGDKGFYLQTPNWSDLKISTALKAATGLSNTAIHATFNSSITPGARSRQIIISAAQYNRLIAYINQSFQYDSAGHIIPIVTNAHYNDADAFYEGTGHYSLFKTCNTWTNAALKCSGQKACLWTVFDTGIFLKYE